MPPPPLLKSEVIEQPIPISVTETPITQAQLISVPVASAQPLLTSAPLGSTKRAKRVSNFNSCFE